jgi:hypothetical protein
VIYSYILVALWMISVSFLLLIPYGIALFYERSFGRKTYAYIFIISIFMYILYSVLYLYSSFFWGNLFFAMGGVLLGCASFRLHQLMTWRQK